MVTLRPLVLAAPPGSGRVALGMARVFAAASGGGGHVLLAGGEVACGGGVVVWW